MSSAPIARRYVQIVPTFKSGAKQIAAQLGADATKAGKLAGENLTKSMSRSMKFDAISNQMKSLGAGFSSVGSKLTANITKPAMGAATVIGGLVTAMGFKRLVGIDTARAQFQGLGHDADAVMEQVDRGITDTSLSMAQGASAAVGILATGAVPLEDLEAQLKRVANVSAAYHVEEEHANYLLNQVLTKQKVTYGDMSQMVQNGIPIWQMLSDEIGVSQEAVQEMASNGEISLEQFNAAIDKSAGSAAEAYAGSFEGMWKNLVSNIGKFGEKLLKPAFEAILPYMDQMLTYVRSPEFAAFAEMIGDKIGRAFDFLVDKVKSLIDWWQNLSPGMQDFIVKAGLAAVAIGPLLMGIGKILTVGGAVVSGIGTAISWGSKLLSGIKLVGGGLKLLWGIMAANPVGAIIAAITAIVAGLVWFFTQTEIGQELWGKFVAWFKDAWEGLKNAFGAVTDWIGDKWQSILDFFGGSGDWLQTNVWDRFTGAWDGVKNAFSASVDWVVGVWDGFKDALARGWDWIKTNVFGPIEDVVGDVFGKVTEFIENHLQIITEAFGVAVAIFTGDWEGAWEGIKNIASLVWDQITLIFGDAWAWIKDKVLDPLAKKLSWLGDAFEVFKKVAVAAWENLKKSLKAIWDWINSKVFDPIKRGVDFVKLGFQHAKDEINRTWDNMKSHLKAGWDWIKSKAFDPLKKGLDAVERAFEATKNGIKTVWDKVKGIAAAPINFVIETVYRDGIKKFVETVASKLGLTVTLPTVSPIRMNRGGRLPGFGGGDRIPTLLEAGEFVINKYAAAKHHPLLAALNGGYGVAPGTVGHALGGGSGGCPGIPGLNKGGWLGSIGSFFGDVGRGIGAFLRDPIGAVAELITKPVEAILGPIDKNIWGDLGKGGARKVLSAIPDFFKKQTDKIGNAGLVGAAAKALGVPYVWGGSSVPPGLDCSGLVYWAAQQLGLGWPRLTAAGYQSGSRMKGMMSAVPGDLLFWGNPASHVGIYTGPGRMIHAPRPGTVVTEAGIYGSPSVGTYAGGGGQGLTHTYAGLVTSTARSARDQRDLGRQLLRSQYDSGGLLQPGYTLAYNGTGKPETVRTFEQESALHRPKRLYVESGDLEITEDGKANLVNLVLRESGLSALSDLRLESALGV